MPDSLLSHSLLIAIGAILGANARYLVNLWAIHRFGPGFPSGTLIVNLTGSLALGFFLSLVTGRLALSPAWRLLLIVGFLGSYTTFSTFTMESLFLLQNRSAWYGIANVLGNNLLGLACALVGVYLARLAGG
jgi:fluoride exporter